MKSNWFCMFWAHQREWERTTTTLDREWPLTIFKSIKWSLVIVMEHFEFIKYLYNFQF